MKIPFTKAHGAHNDFLLTWRDRLPPELSGSGSADFAAAAVTAEEAAKTDTRPTAPRTLRLPDKPYNYTNLDLPAHFKGRHPPLAGKRQSRFHSGNNS